MTSTEKSKKRREEIRELARVHPDHPRVLREQERIRGNVARRLARLKAIAQENPDHPRLVRLRATNARNKRSERERNPGLAKQKRVAWETDNRDKLKAQNARKLAKLQGLAETDPNHPRVVALKKRTRLAQRRYKLAHPDRKPNYSPEAKERQRLRRNMGCRLLTELRKYRNGAQKSDKFLNLLGCSIKSFMVYIESKWQPEMSWDNYGSTGWHLDHIIPCAIFDLSLPEHQEYCFHFSNCQPLWHAQNIAKYSHATPEQRAIVASLTNFHPNNQTENSARNRAQ